MKLPWLRRVKIHEAIKRKEDRNEGIAGTSSLLCVNFIKTSNFQIKADRLRKRTAEYTLPAGRVRCADQDRRTRTESLDVAASVAGMLLKPEFIIKSMCRAGRLYLARKGLTRPCDASALHVAHRRLITPERAMSTRR